VSLAHLGLTRKVSLRSGYFRLMVRFRQRQERKVHNWCLPLALALALAWVFWKADIPVVVFDPSSIQYELFPYDLVP
jgi:hypothetical protein